jgi:hypothetical protein
MCKEMSVIQIDGVADKKSIIRINGGPRRGRGTRAQLKAQLKNGNPSFPRYVPPERIPAFQYLRKLFWRRLLLEASLGAKKSQLIRDLDTVSISGVRCIVSRRLFQS